MLHLLYEMSRSEKTFLLYKNTIMQDTRPELKMLFTAMSEKPIAYHRIYSEITGSLTAGVLLSQLVYWDGVMKGKEFYKTDKDFTQELAMGSKELKNAKKRISELKLVSIKRKGVPAKTYYKVDIDNIINVITNYAEQEQLVMPKGTNWIDRKGTTITESTSENKQYTISTTNKNKFTQEQLQTYMDTYNKALNRNSRLTNKKLQDKLNTRIQEYTFDEIIRSLENMFSKDFYKGVNDRQWTPNPTWILENNERLEQFLYMKPLKTKVQDTSQEFNELDNLDEFTPEPL